MYIEERTAVIFVAAVGTVDGTVASSVAVDTLAAVAFELVRSAI